MKEEIKDKEVEFLDQITSPIKETIKTELDSLIEVYNNILMGLMKLNMNLEILTTECIKNPERQDLFQQKDKVAVDIGINEQAVTVLRQQILNKLKPQK